MLAAPESLPDLRADAPPVLLVHGDADTMIPIQALFAATGALGRAGVLVQWHISTRRRPFHRSQGLSLGGSFLAMAVRGRLRRPQGDVCCPSAESCGIGIVAANWSRVRPGVVLAFGGFPVMSGRLSEEVGSSEEQSRC